MSLVAKHCIENDEQLAHARGKGWLGMLAPGAQPQIEDSDGRIAADCRDRCHVQDAPDLGASAPNTTSAVQATAITVKRRQARQGGDLLAIEFSQLGQVGEQGPRQHGADTGNGSQQLITFTPYGSVTNHGGEFLIEAGEPLFQPADVLVDAAI